MAGSVVRELVTLWGFDIDKKPLQELDAGINAIKGSLKAVGIAAAATAAGIGFLLNEAGKQEQTNVAFETMVGNVEEAHELLKDLYAFAAKTPFTIPDIEKNAKLLLGMGVGGNKLLPTLKALGDVSAGLSVPIGRLALNFGQVKAQTKLTGREMRDFAIAGVPLLGELAKNMNITKQEVMALVSAGKVGFAEVEKAFISMSSSGGRFNNLMIKQSKTFKGLISNAQDFGIIMARELGNEVLPLAKEIVETLLEWVQVNKKLIMNDLKAFLKILVGFFEDLIGLVSTFKDSIDGFVQAFGGWNKVLRTTFKLFTAIMGLGMVAGIGLLTKSVYGLALAWKTMGWAALWAQIKMAAIPLAIGAIVVAIGLIAEDILAFSQGRDSVFGRMLNGITSIFDQILEKMRNFGKVGQIIFAVLMTPIRIIVNMFKVIGTMIDMVTGKMGKLEGLKKIGKAIANNYGFGTSTLEGALGLADGVTGAANTVEQNNNPITGLGGMPFGSSGDSTKAINVKAENKIDLNVTGMDAETAKEMVGDTLNDQLGGVLRETIRDGESQIER